MSGWNRSLRMKFTSIASIAGTLAGLAAVSIGGYNLITTGCPLGSCSAEAITTPVSSVDEHNCALGCGHESHEGKTIAAGAVSEKAGCAKTCGEGDVIAAGSVSEKKECAKTECDKSEKCCTKAEGTPEVKKDPV
jgi:hypothetical protein